MQSNNARIAKNTIYLYFRMIITMLVALYTSREVLGVLGVVDYGIYNVVGGVVSMLNFVTNSMASASQRFLSYEIGKKNLQKLKDTFSVTVSIYIVIVIVIVLVSETIGLWFVKNKLTIPESRLNAALWSYHFSVLAFVFSILRVPYNALIIANEKMKFFALNSIVEVVLKLLIVFFLIYFNSDKLILYAALIALVIFIVTVVYYFYCKYNFEESKYKFIFDKHLFRSIFGFAGWNLFDSTANVAKNEGVNILLNVFFTPIVNASRGIAFQVSSQVINLVGNFQIAAAPQIIKYYAGKEYDKMKTLYFQSSKYSFYLLYLLLLPLYLNLDVLLEWWLKEVPKYTLSFLQLIFINRLVDTFAGTTNILVQATGKIKKYQIFSGFLILLNLPISYIFLKFVSFPEVTILISISLSVLIVFIRLNIMNILTPVSISDYIKKVIFPDLKVFIIPFLISGFIYLELDHGIFSFLLITIVSIISTVIVIFYFGLDKLERKKLVVLLKKKTKRI